MGCTKLNFAFTYPLQFAKPEYFNAVSIGVILWKRLWYWHNLAKLRCHCCKNAV